MKNYGTRLTATLFSIYLLTLLWILLLKLGVHFSYMEHREVNLIPFRELLTSLGKLDLPETILNILIFVPLGIYAGVLFQTWTWQNKILFALCVSFIVETLQYLLSIGAFDVTDIITNTSGGIIGFALLKILDKGFRTPAGTQKFVNVVSTIGTVVLLSLLVLLKLNMLPIRYQ